MEYYLKNKQKPQLTSTLPPLLTTAVAFVLPLGVASLAPSAAVAVSTSWGETITLTSILAGYESILLGLDEVGMGGELVGLDQPFIDFADTFASLSVSGTIGGMELTLDRCTLSMR